MKILKPIYYQLMVRDDLNEEYRKVGDVLDYAVGKILAKHLTERLQKANLADTCESVLVPIFTENMQ